MGASGVEEASATGEETVRAARPEPSFTSAAQLRQVFDEFLTAIDGDPEVGPRMRAAGYRVVFTDFELVLDVTPVGGDRHQLRWEFSQASDSTPALTMEMESAVANRYLQGRENLAIAIARGRIRVDCKARAALGFFALTRRVVQDYRDVIERDHPDLVVV